MKAKPFELKSLKSQKSWKIRFVNECWC